jgi:hypothetical protein
MVDDVTGISVKLAEIRAVYEQAVSEGYVPRGQHVGTGKRTAIAEAASRLGIKIETAKRWLNEALLANIPASHAITPSPAVLRTEKSQSDYWRAKAKALEDDLTRLEADFRLSTGILARPVAPPKWSVPAKPGKKGRVAGLLLVSDLHNGEVVRADEVHGANEYNPSIFRDRIRRLFAAAVEILPRWSADSALVGNVVAVNGDLVSGDIHDELRRTNEGTAFEQVYAVADELAAGVEKVATLGPVWVTFTPGNHGRTTEKTHAKRVSMLSYDLMVGELVKRHFATRKDVVVLLSSGPDLEFSVLGFSVFQSHGDALGTGGGKGFAGPVLPIARGAKNVELQAYRMRKRHDVILTAHYHTSSNPARGVLANGSVVGFNEYANRIRASIEPPQQWLALLHEKWGIRERCEIQLGDAKPAGLSGLTTFID